LWVWMVVRGESGPRPARGHVVMLLQPVVPRYRTPEELFSDPNGQPALSKAEFKEIMLWRAKDGMHFISQGLDQNEKDAIASEDPKQWAAVFEERLRNSGRDVRGLGIEGFLAKLLAAKTIKVSENDMSADAVHEHCSNRTSSESGSCDFVRRRPGHAY
jgi:hypothetical protein